MREGKSRKFTAFFQAVIQLQRETLLLVVFNFSGLGKHSHNCTQNLKFCIALYSFCLTCNSVSRAFLLLHTSGISRVSAAISLLSECSIKLEHIIPRIILSWKHKNTPAPNVHTVINKVFLILLYSIRSYAS